LGVWKKQTTNRKGKVMKNSKVVVCSLATLLTVILVGCKTVRIPTLSASVGRSQSQTGSAILLSGENFLPNHTYGVGIFTSGSPRKIGNVTTDGAGNINNVKLEYECQSINEYIVGVEVYELDGQDLGAGIAQTKTDRPTCF
jgi:hypothetical protein